MALVKCIECGKEISNQASKCPQCGYSKPVKQTSDGPSGCLLIVIGIVIFIALAGTFGGSKPSPSTAAEDINATARGLCMMWIKEQLHDPASAEFEHSSSTLIAKNGDVWTVVRPLRAKNGFNAMRSTSFVCTMKKSGTSFDKIKVTEITPR